MFRRILTRQILKAIIIHRRTSYRRPLTLADASMAVIASSWHHHYANAKEMRDWNALLSTILLLSFLLRFVRCFEWAIEFRRACARCAHATWSNYRSFRRCHIIFYECESSVRWKRGGLRSNGVKLPICKVERVFTKSILCHEAKLFPVGWTANNNNRSSTMVIRERLDVCLKCHVSSAVDHKETQERASACLDWWEENMRVCSLDDCLVNDFA